MSNAIQIEFPRRDIEALRAQMDRAQKELGKSLGASVKLAAWSVSRTLGTSTRVAPKVRKVMPLRKSGFSDEYKSSFLSWKKPFIVLVDRGWQSREEIIWEKSITRARKNKWAVIKYHGLAKAAWGWAVKKLGPKSDMKGVSDPARGKAASQMAVESQLKGDDPVVRLTNRVKYAAAALKGGARDVNTAIARAAKYMAAVIDGNIKKQFKT
jgi:hypothetical protein